MAEHAKLPIWRRSSRCSESECLEIAATPGGVLLRRTVGGAAGGVLEVSAAEWSTFAQAVRDGEFADLTRD